VQHEIHAQYLQEKLLGKLNLKDRKGSGILNPIMDGKRIKVGTVPNGRFWY
jgi:hypothetical protein